MRTQATVRAGAGAGAGLGLWAGARRACGERGLQLTHQLVDPDGGHLRGVCKIDRTDDVTALALSCTVVSKLSIQKQTVCLIQGLRLNGG